MNNQVTTFRPRGLDFLHSIECTARRNAGNRLCQIVNKRSLEHVSANSYLSPEPINLTVRVIELTRLLYTKILQRRYYYFFFTTLYKRSRRSPACTYNPVWFIDSTLKWIHKIDYSRNLSFILRIFSNTPEIVTNYVHDPIFGLLGVKLSDQQTRIIDEGINTILSHYIAPVEASLSDAIAATEAIDRSIYALYNCFLNDEQKLMLLK